ncbi:MAG: translation initiation factor IF-2, partial [Flavobacteriales bacterium]
MSKPVYEIARELGVSSPELVLRLGELGVDVGSPAHLRELDEEQIAMVTQSFEAKKPRDTVKKVVSDGVIRRRVRRKVAGASADKVDAAPVAEAAESAPIEAPIAASSVAEAEASPPKKRQRMATVVTRAPEDLAPPAEPVVEIVAAEVPVVVEEAAEEAVAPTRNRFATVVTRTDADKPRVSAGDAPAAEPAVEVPRRRFATVVTTGGGQQSERPSLKKLAASQSSPAAAPSEGAARITGAMNQEQLRERLQADNKDFRPGPRPAAGVAERKGKKQKGKRVVSSRDLYDGFARNRRGKKRDTGPAQQTKITQAAEHKRVVKMEETILVSDLAHQMSIKAGEIAMKLMFDLGIKGANINTAIDFDTTTLLAEMYSFKVEQVGFDITNYLPKIELALEGQQTRPPVVTVMGHVDHGKTSLLDALRSASVATGEAGGITQHIGAYTVMLESGRLTFLDTPGHEAFTALRARGAVATDITILVVAADDGVMPQTVEAINHSKDAGVPIIVAVNKCDKENANPERVRQALAQYDLVPEEWGGTTLFVEVSAKTQHNMDKLLDAIHMQAELLELKAHYDRPAEGLVIESKLDVGRGPVATVLVQEGRLKPGDTVVVGEHYGRIRTMSDERGT